MATKRETKRETKRRRNIINELTRLPQGQSPDTEIGRVYVFDLDDWDLPDKKFYWEGLEHAQFKLDEDTGMIYMKSGTHDGRYHLRFKVYDRKHTQTDVPANVTVTVKTIPHEAVLNSGSVRISGITDEDFIRIWDYKVSLVVVVVVARSRETISTDPLVSVANHVAQ